MLVCCWSAVVSMLVCCWSDVVSVACSFVACNPMVCLIHDFRHLEHQGAGHHRPQGWIDPGVLGGRGLQLQRRRRGGHELRLQVHPSPQRDLRLPGQHGLARQRQRDHHQRVRVVSPPRAPPTHPHTACRAMDPANAMVNHPTTAEPTMPPGGRSPLSTTFQVRLFGLK